VKLHVDRLSDSPTPFRFELTPAWWREVSGGRENDAEGVAEGFEAELHAHKMGADVYLAGELRGALALECGRCLARYRQPVREAFRLVLEPAGDRIPADPEGAAALARDGLYLSDELEAGWFRGSELDLGGFFQEGIALLFPVQPLCREGCRGLCPRCGVDRNSESCSCPEASPSSPFAALRGLRNQMTGGDER
jgi:uncharacterized protein